MLSLDLGIDAQSIAAATIARHRSIARRAGVSERVVDSPAYRATLARHTADMPRVKRAGFDSATAQQIADAILRLPAITVAGPIEGRESP